MEKLCIQCRVAEVKPRTVQYKDVDTGTIYRGQTTFCSVSCEVSYHQKMNQLHPQVACKFMEV